MSTRHGAAAALTAVLLTLITTGTATAAPRTVGPGALMVSQVDRNVFASCTANFVFRSATTVFLGFAAHCSATDESLGRSGCREQTLPLGSAVTITGSDGQDVRGRLAYNSWRAMREQRETDDELCMFNDFALVALDAAVVDPSVPVFGGPTGLAADGPAAGDAVFSFQPQNGGSGRKVGEAATLVDGESDSELTYRVQTSPPGDPGDSGSGYLDADGRAFGVLSTQFLDGEQTNGVTDLARALDYANRFGDVGTVRLVPGTVPFRGA